MSSWLKVRSFKPVPREEWDNPNVMEWFNDETRQLLKVSAEVFDKNGSLIVRTAQQWNKEFVILKQMPPKDKTQDAPNVGDDVPF